MTTSAVGEPSTRLSTGAANERAPGRRGDLDGLRAFAILLVVIYHVWLGRVSGGVDVFLLLSAYFLTASFVRRSASLSSDALPRFWVRRFAQLVPAAAATIFAILAFTAIVLPPSQWRAQWAQAWASLFYVQNWELTSASVDYYARTENFPSALQHFWSLSVQGQVFLLWPVIIFLGVAISRAIRQPARLTLAVVFGVIFVASFAWAIHLTAVDQPVAYFNTWARLWEFALGSLAALLLPSVRIPRWAGVLLGWTGLVALLTCGIILDVGAGFPGVVALWPTLAAVAVILGGQTSAPTSSSRFLSSGAFARLGRIAYPLYLVHWPILVAYMVVRDTTSVGPRAGLLVIVVSFLAAIALNAFVERPVRAWLTSARTAAGIVAVGALAVAVPLGAWQGSESVRTILAGPQSNPGAAVLMPWMAATAREGEDVAPRGTDLDSEWVWLSEDCSGANEVRMSSLEGTCSQTVRDENAPTLLAVGDSHAAQWLGALDPVLEEEGWNTVALLKGGCAMGPDEWVRDECIQWRTDAQRYAEDLGAAVVVTMGTKAVPDAPDERAQLGIGRAISSFVAAGSHVILLRDNPRFGFDMYACAEESDNWNDCAVDATDVLAPSNPASDLTIDELVYALDFTEYLCPDGVCEPVIGNVAVYMDDNHLTWTYARTLAPAVRAALAEIPGIPIG